MLEEIAPYYCSVLLLRTGYIFSYLADQNKTTFSLARWCLAPGRGEVTNSDPRHW
jgi:hypothetical protein